MGKAANIEDIHHSTEHRTWIAEHRRQRGPNAKYYIVLSLQKFRMNVFLGNTSR